MVVSRMEPGTRLELHEGRPDGRTIASWVLVAAGCVEEHATTLAVLAPADRCSGVPPRRYLVIRQPQPQQESRPHAQHAQAGSIQALGQPRTRRHAEVGLRPLPFTQA